MFGLFKKSKKKGKESNSSLYKEWLVKDIVRETKEAVSFVFDSPKENTNTYKSGQFLTLIVSPGDQEERRAYSLSSSPFVDEDLTVTVKRVSGGIVSNYLLDTLKKGDTVKVIAPAGRFVTDYDEQATRRMVMFAGGSGITPILSIIKSMLYKEPNSTVSLLYFNRDVDSIIFKDKLESLQQTYHNQFQVFNILDEAPKDWSGYSGLPDDGMLSKLVNKISEWDHEDTTYWICGPEGMMYNVEQFLQRHDIPKSKIFSERFVQATLDEATKKNQVQPGSLKVREVLIRHDGEDYKIKVEPDSTILESALDRGIDLPYSCQSGLCTACRGKALSGKVMMDEEEALSQSERDEGYVLTCVGHPLTDDVVIEIDS